MKRSLLQLVAIAMVAAALLAIGPVASRYYLADELASRAFDAHEPRPALIPGLAKLDRLGLEPLAAAAAGPDQAVASSARREIERLVNRWKRLSLTNRGFTATPRLERLAEELEHNADRFGPRGQLWLAKVADQMLAGNSHGSPQLAQTCDNLLQTARKPTDVPDPKLIVRSNQEAPKPANKPTTDLDSEPKSPAVLNWQPQRPEATPLGQFAKQNPEPAATDPMQSQVAVPVPQPLPSMVSAQPITEETSPLPGLPTEPPVAGDLTWQPPTVSGPKGHRRNLPNRAGSLGALPLVLAALINTPDRPLIRLALTAQSGGSRNLQPLLREILVARGFGSTPVEHLQMAVAPNEADRLLLIDQLLDLRSGDTARMLLLLASDTAPPVRAAAISALGSSQDRRLIEAAWQLAIRDRDPRVAKLANELRSRR